MIEVMTTKLPTNLCNLKSSPSKNTSFKNAKTTVEVMIIETNAVFSSSFSAFNIENWNIVPDKNNPKT